MSLSILYLHQYYCPTGGYGNNRSADFARIWAKAGHKVTVLTSTAYFPKDHPAHQHKVYEFEENGVKVIALRVPYSQELSLWRKALAFIQFWWRARQILNQLPTLDIIYASTTPPTVGELGRRLARRHRIPWVLEVVDVWPDVPIGMGLVTNPILRDFLHWAVNRLYRDAGHIIALSEGMAQQITSHRVPPEKISVAHNGTDIQAFKPIEYLFDANVPVRILYTGAIGRANGVQALIRAMARLAEDANLPQYELHIYGWGAELADTQSLTIQLGLSNVHFHPPVPKEQLAKLMPTFDVGVVTFAPFPVLEANSANKFYDYLAAGLPVVLNYEGWQAEYLTHWQCGLSAPMGNELAFADVLRRLIADAPLRQSMRPRARQLAEAHFSREALAGQALEVLALQAFE